MWHLLFHLPSTLSQLEEALFHQLLNKCNLFSSVCFAGVVLCVTREQENKDF